MPKVTEVTFVTDTGVTGLNEDAYIINDKDKVYGVFDGASSLVPYRSKDNKTGAYIASHIAADVFNKHLSGSSILDLARTANELVEQEHTAAGIDSSDPINRFCSTVIVLHIIDDSRAEILQLGDSIALVIDKVGTVTLPVTFKDLDQANLQKWKQFTDQGVSDKWERVLPDVKALRARANIGYGLINGDAKIDKFLHVTPVDLTNVRSILLLSDGMYPPKTDPSLPEDWELLATLYERGGLEAVLKHVRDLENSDPTLSKYPRYKHHDDATGIALDFA